MAIDYFCVCMCWGKLPEAEHSTSKLQLQQQAAQMQPQKLETEKQFKCATRPLDKKHRSSCTKED